MIIYIYFFSGDTCNGSRRHLVGNSCYFVPLVRNQDKLFTWWDARYLCKESDNLGPTADLVAIETKQEMDNIKNILLNHFGGMCDFFSK